MACVCVCEENVCVCVCVRGRTAVERGGDGGSRVAAAAVSKAACHQWGKERPANVVLLKEKAPS